MDQARKTCVHLHERRTHPAVSERPWNNRPDNVPPCGSPPHRSLCLGEVASRRLPGPIFSLEGSRRLGRVGLLLHARGRGLRQSNRCGGAGRRAAGLPAAALYCRCIVLVHALAGHNFWAKQKQWLLGCWRFWVQSREPLAPLANS